MEYNEIDGDLISLALEGKFDVIVHGCNCFNTQASGIAAGMVKNFKTNTFKMEGKEYKGDINKLGTIDYTHFSMYQHTNRLPPELIMSSVEDIYYKDIYLTVVNAYTQYRYGTNHPDGQYKPVDYDAICLVMRKINHIFKFKHIGLPLIGCGLAGGSWEIVKSIIQKELKDCKVTIVKFKK